MLIYSLGLFRGKRSLPQKLHLPNEEIPLRLLESGRSAFIRIAHCGTVRAALLYRWDIHYRQAHVRSVFASYVSKIPWSISHSQKNGTHSYHDKRNGKHFFSITALHLYSYLIILHKKIIEYKTLSFTYIHSHLCFKLKDLLGFLILAVFVVLGVGIYYHANLWPDHQTIWNGDWTNWRIWTIIYYPYWQLYAELNLESLDGKLSISFACAVHDLIVILHQKFIICF